jgi:hypothetical protein
LAAALFNAIWWYARHGHRLLASNIDPAGVKAISRRFLSALAWLGAGTLLGALLPALGVARSVCWPVIPAMSSKSLSTWRTVSARFRLSRRSAGQGFTGRGAARAQPGSAALRPRAFLPPGQVLHRHLHSEASRCRRPASGEGTVMSAVSCRARFLSESNEISGSQSGSQRRQPPGDAGLCPATISSASWPYRRQ